MEERLELFMQNPYWKAAIDSCPSAACREYLIAGLVNGFYYGSNPTDSIAESEKSLTVEDWKYLKKYAANTPLRTKCNQMIAKCAA